MDIRHVSNGSLTITGWSPQAGQCVVQCSTLGCTAVVCTAVQYTCTALQGTILLYTAVRYTCTAVYCFPWPLEVTFWTAVKRENTLLTAGSNGQSHHWPAVRVSTGHWSALARVSTGQSQHWPESALASTLTGQSQPACGTGWKGSHFSN